MKIYLIRHGKTTANEEKKYSGKQDVSLSDSGKEELKNIASSLSYLNGVPLYVSGLKRTKQTKDILFPNSEILDTLSFMNETDFGDFEGKTYTDLKNDKNYIKWITDITNEVPLNGESYTVFKERVLVNFLEHIKTLKEDTIYVTHGGVIRMIMSEVVDSSITFFDWKIPNGKGYVLEYNNNTIIGYEEL